MSENWKIFFKTLSKHEFVMDEVLPHEEAMAEVERISRDGVWVILVDEDESEHYVPSRAINAIGIRPVDDYEEVSEPPFKPGDKVRYTWYTDKEWHNVVDTYLPEGSGKYGDFAEVHYVGGGWDRANTLEVVRDPV